MCIRDSLSTQPFDKRKAKAQLTKQQHILPPANIWANMQFVEHLLILFSLGEVFEFKKGEDAPIYSHGSPWISHKRQALQRAIDSYGTYISQLTSLTADSSVNSTDKA